jgi:isopenicillin-N epimerase
MPAVDWSDARARMMLDPTVTNLNTGSFGALPRVIFERVTELRRCLAAEPMDFLVRRVPPLLWEAGERLARFVGADPSGEGAPACLDAFLQHGGGSRLPGGGAESRKR